MAKKNKNRLASSDIVKQKIPYLCCYEEEGIIEKFGKKATFLGDTLEELQYVNAEGFYTYIKE